MEVTFSDNNLELFFDTMTELFKAENVLSNRFESKANTVDIELYQIGDQYFLNIDHSQDGRKIEIYDDRQDAIKWFDFEVDKIVAPVSVDTSDSIFKTDENGLKYCSECREQLYCSVHDVGNGEEELI